jgi:hypothetical protein
MKLLFGALMLLFSLSVLADSSQSVNVPVTSTTSVGVPISTVSNGSNLSNAVGAAMAPALTTTFSETCMGSTSMGAGFAGGAVSIGSTWTDEECIRRLSAREIRTFGDVFAAKEIMCGNVEVRQAFKRVGRPCAIDGGIYATTAVTVTEESKRRQETLYIEALERLSLRK